MAQNIGYRRGGKAHVLRTANGALKHLGPYEWYGTAAARTERDVPELLRLVYLCALFISTGELNRTIKNDVDVE